MKIGRKIIRLQSCTSTNDVASEMAVRGEKEGTVVVADQQTKGRGTKGRKWYSEETKGLYFSVILRPQRKDVSLLPLAMGVAVRDALFQTEGLQAGLKWPNDIVFDGKKLGGILCEGSFIGEELSYAVLGVGLNINHSRMDFPVDFRSQAISLKLALRKSINLEKLLPSLWKMLNFWYRLFLQKKEAHIIKAFQEHSVFSSGERMEVITDRGEIAGEYRGVDERGRLLLQTQETQRSFLAAEVIHIKTQSKEGKNAANRRYR